jgi:hypothetical protein
MSPRKGNPAAAHSCSPPFHGSTDISRIIARPPCIPTIASFVA